MKKMGALHKSTKQSIMTNVGVRTWCKKKREWETSCHRSGLGGQADAEVSRKVGWGTLAFGKADGARGAS